jgi:imidazolonepropionase-like amidohydrolase
MKRDGELGSISAGKLADVVLVNGNPAANISDIHKMWVVVKDGVCTSRRRYTASWASSREIGERVGLPPMFR